MKELVEKFQKMSSAQLVDKIEKGVENEAEKNVIINILQKRGRDTTPYSGKTKEEIAEEVKLDRKQKAEGKPKAEKKVREPKTDSGSSSRRKVKFEDDTFKAGSVVTSSTASLRLPEGETAVVKYTFHFEGKEAIKMAYLKNSAGKSLKKKLSDISLASEQPQVEKSKPTKTVKEKAVQEPQVETAE